MTIPIATLLGFAAWTLILLLGTVGIWRWARILTGRMKLTEFPADQLHGSTGYRRAIRAHANCIENLPVFATIVLVLEVTQTGGLLVDQLCIAILAARLAQSLVHITFTETSLFIGIRFSFFLVQILAMLTLIVLILQVAPVDISAILDALPTGGA